MHCPSPHSWQPQHWAWSCSLEQPSYSAGFPSGDRGGGWKCCSQLHKPSLRGYTDALGGPVGKKDIFLDRGPFITSHSGHAVMSDSTLKPCRGMQPPQEAWASWGGAVHSGSFGRGSALKAGLAFLTPAGKGSSTFCQHPRGGRGRWMVVHWSTCAVPPNPRSVVGCRLGLLEL